MAKTNGLPGATSLLSDDAGLSTAASLYSFEPQDFAAKAAATPPSAPVVAIPTLYLTEKGDTSAISVDDINQGQIGDCFLLSSIGEIAMLQPSFISSAIHLNSDGSETVNLYKSANGSLPGWNTTAYKSFAETVTNVFPSYSVNNGATQDVLSGHKEIWPQVLEKAVATMDGGYAAISGGGSPVLAMEELTGHAATYVTPGSLTLAELQGFSKAGDLLVMDTLSASGLPDNLVSDHAYMFEGVTGSGSAASIKLGNPWGFDQPAPILLSQLSHGISEVDIGHLS